MSETPSDSEGKDVVVAQFRKQIDFLKSCDIDFIICEVSTGRTVLFHD